MMKYFIDYIRQTSKRDGIYLVPGYDHEKLYLFCYDEDGEETCCP